MTICDYELERERRIAENRRKIQDLGVVQGAAELRAQQQRPPTAAAGNPSGPKRRERPALEPSEIRKSSREVKRPNYREEDFIDSSLLRGGAGRHRSPGGAGGKGRAGRVVDEDELKALRAQFAAGNGREPARSQVDSGRGVRIQGGRVYDSALGVTCHWCRQKTLEDHVTCEGSTCGGGRRMPVSFCKRCLWNRHGEDVHAAKASGQWVCPMCRGSCGPGCANCCNCGPCRKKLGLPPTRQLAREAREAGLSNVHDYLIHLETGEDPADITARKARHQWGAWLSTPEAGTAEMPPEGSAAPAATITAVFPKSKPSAKARVKSQEPSAPVASMPSTRRSSRVKTARGQLL